MNIEIEGTPTPDQANVGGPKADSANALLELRQFIASELDPAMTPDGSVRSFRPLTDGLGLDSPKPKVEAAPPIPVRMKAPRPMTPSRPELHPTLPLREIPEPPKALAELMEKTLKPMDMGPSAAPPPIPRATAFRRFLAVVIDQIFVLGLFAGALLLTLRVLSGASPQFSPEAAMVVKSPMFLRFAILEFATLWLSYLAVGIGLLDMTFGMWVWGLRVGYGNTSEGHAVKKLTRILLSFFFAAPIFPLVLLMFHRKGRNLLDALTGSTLYRVAL